MTGMNRQSVAVRPITDDLVAVADFFHQNHNRAVAPDRWLRVLTPPWPVEAPNRGFQLVAPQGVVGAYLAVYADRDWGGSQRLVCNLAALCVLPEFRIHTMRLVRALLAQPGLVFTDLSPSGNVIRLNERSGFHHLDTATRLTLNAPSPPERGVRVTGSPRVLSATLTGDDRRIYRDHRDAAAAKHLVVSTAAGYAYLVFRRDRRKGLPLFASPLYVGGDRELLAASWAHVGSYLLRRHRLPATLAEGRVLGFLPRWGRQVRQPRPRMFRSKGVAAPEVDYLYSELTLLEW